MKIIKLQTENVKKLTAVEITPEGNLVIIGGKNGAGKSSVLDSIMYALAGGDSLPPKPVRRGEDKAKIEIDLGDIIVKRTFTAAGGTSLVVSNKDGVKFASPQAMLDGLVGRLSFDPLEFAQQKPDKQSETLTALLGLDFTPIETETDKLFNERTSVNREVKALQNRLAAMPFHADATGEEQSTEHIFAEQEKAAKVNSDNTEARHKQLGLETQGRNNSFALQRTRNTITQLRQSLAAAETELRILEEESASLIEQMEAHEKIVEALKDRDLSVFKTQLATAESHNRKLRENKAKEEVRKQFAAKEKESEALTAKLDALAKQKRQTIANAKFPIEGLGLDDTRNVTFDGLPFEQASTALQLRVSVAIGLALNKKLPVLLIRRGSDLDEESLKLVAEMAEQAQAQVWLERVGADGNVSVIIEDGHVQEPVPA